MLKHPRSLSRFLWRVGSGPIHRALGKDRLKAVTTNPAQTTGHGTLAFFAPGAAGVPPTALRRASAGRRLPGPQPGGDPAGPGLLGAGVGLHRPAPGRAPDRP